MQTQLTKLIAAKKVPLTKIKREAKIFINDTTMHGLINISNNKNWPYKLCWIGLVLLAVSATLYCKLSKYHSLYVLLPTDFEKKTSHFRHCGGDYKLQRVPGDRFVGHCLRVDACVSSGDNMQSNPVRPGGQCRLEADARVGALLQHHTALIESGYISGETAHGLLEGQHHGQEARLQHKLFKVVWL